MGPQEFVAVEASPLEHFWFDRAHPWYVRTLQHLRHVVVTSLGSVQP